MKWGLVIFSIGVFCNAHAQTNYFEDNQIWDTHYSHYYLGISCATLRNTVYYVNGDTVFNGNAYKKIGRRYEESYTQFGSWPCNNPLTSVEEAHLFLRQSNDSIMEYDPWFGTESLFIDYNLGVGDTFELTNHVIDTFVVEAITNITIGLQNHRVFHVDTASNHQIIEGIGFIGPNASEVFQSIHFNPSDDYYTLRCHAQNSVTEWINPLISNGSCEYLFYLNDSELQSSGFIIYPNPASGILNIEGINKVEGIIYSIFDLQGKLVLSDKLVNTSIDLSHLPRGPYVLSINGCYSELLIK